jgi:DNA-binding response OmpR family regulator
MGTTTSRKMILVYSDDSTVRAAIVSALGKRVSADLPEHDISEFATADALRVFVDASPSGRKVDLIILDAEAVPEGGMGVSRQLKDEVFQCPPVLLITARPDDAWLAAWSRADASVLAPIDPFTFANVAAGLLRPPSVVHAHGATH